MPLLKDWIVPYSNVVAPTRYIDSSTAGKIESINYYNTVPVRDWEYGWFASFKDLNAHRDKVLRERSPELYSSSKKRKNSKPYIPRAQNLPFREFPKESTFLSFMSNK